MPITCCFPPQGRTYEAYVAYLNEQSGFAAQMHKIDVNLQVIQQLVKNAVAKAGPNPKMSLYPDEAYWYTMRALSIIDIGLMKQTDDELLKYGSSKKKVRQTMKECIDIAEALSAPGGPLEKLHKRVLSEELSQDSMREELLKKQYEKGELAEDEISAHERTAPNDEEGKKVHEIGRQDVIEARSAEACDKLSRFSAILAPSYPKTVLQTEPEGYSRIQSKLANPPPVIKSPTPTIEIPAAKLENRPPQTTDSPQMSPSPTDPIFVNFPRLEPTIKWQYSSAGNPARVGLRNLGNTCFMNSVLQCLYTLRTLRTHIEKEEYLIDFEVGEGNKGRVINSLAEVFRNLSESRVTVNPSSLKRTIGERNESFSGFSQQDASEFFLSLVNEVHSDMNNKKWMVKPQEEQSNQNDMAMAVDSARRYFRNNSLNSIIPRLFMFQTRSITRCLECGQTSKVMNTEMSLELPFPSDIGGVIELEQLMKQYCKKERFNASGPKDSANGYKCDRCCKYVSADRQTTIFSYPQVLVVTLKRFKSYGNFSDKISSCVAFPETLSLKPYYGASSPQPSMPAMNFIMHHLQKELAGCEPSWEARKSREPGTYRLSGIVNHRGNVHGGHYTADVRDDERHCWARISDEVVNKADKPDRVLGYMLFYELL